MQNSGGIGAELTGGNFFQGFVIGGVVAGLNHVMHPRDDNGYEQNGKKINNKGDLISPLFLFYTVTFS